jgi:hypothetical protein
MEMELTQFKSVSITEPNQPSNNQSQNEKMRDYDYCLVFQSSEHNRLTAVAKKILLHLVDIGFDVYVFRPNEGDYDYALLRLKSLDSLRDFAESMGFLMKLDPRSLKAHCKSCLININEDPIYSKISPYDHIFIKYQKKHEELFWKTADMTHPFRPSLRLKLTEQLLMHGPTIVGGDEESDSIAGFNIDTLCKLNFVQGCFPMPDENAKRRLSEQWLSLFGPTAVNMPSFQIREYFGENIGLYFEVSESTDA